MPVDAATRRAFTSLVAAACIDGRVSEPEAAYLRAKAGEFGIARGEADEFIQQGQQGRFTVAIPPTPAGKQALFDELLDVVCADGRLESQEKQLLLRFSSHLGVDPGDLGLRVRERLNRRRNDAPSAPPPRPTSTPRAEPVMIIDDVRPKPAPPPPPPPRRPESAPPRPEPVRIAEIRPQPTVGPSQLGGQRLADAVGVTKSAEASQAGAQKAATPMIADMPSMQKFRERSDQGVVEKLMALPPGPVTLGERTVSQDEISPITRGLVAGMLRFDGREAAIRYLATTGISDVAAATRIVDRVIAEDPSLVPNRNA